MSHQFSTDFQRITRPKEVKNQSGMVACTHGPGTLERQKWEGSLESMSLRPGCATEREGGTRERFLK